MEYAQLNPDGSYSHQITTHGNVEWDATHFCPASALTAQEATLFRVVPLLETEPPVFNPLTHACQRNGGELVNGQWQYKWDVIALTPEQAQAQREAAIAVKWEAIKAERDRRKAAGVKAGGHWFHSDADSRIQQLALFVMGASVPAVPWKTLDGSFVTMTQALAGQIFQGTALNDMALFAAGNAHEAALQASERPDTYDFSAGWPATFGGAA